eukprot:NODE_4694_length_1129_cov_31.135189_g4161_i0.p1 GENE.NODE_4694_length_1129_cov_31.135189_g4161_i0~~NODE_4694_length_1129_cov_31.135189_g4161_i0.p1  ORF type:complete len:336 (+),score=47.67 NODE_4694_length_1129_cov_31.135189_g4161_i0:40-1008(+)
MSFNKLVVFLLPLVCFGQDFPYSGNGPFDAYRLPSQQLDAPESTGCKGFCKVEFSAYIPKGNNPTIQPPYPLAIFTPGFTYNSYQYHHIHERLASWGYVVAVWNTTGENPLSFLTFDPLVNLARWVLDHVNEEAANSSSPLYQIVKATEVLLVGHSRGGLVSVLTAENETRAIGVVGIDPVDCPPPFHERTPAYPSAVEGLYQNKTRAKLAYLGSELGGEKTFGIVACAPTSCNYQKFYAATNSPTWSIEVMKVGHDQFMNPRPSLNPCVSGSGSDDFTSDTAATVTVAWAEYVMRNVNIQQYITTWASNLQAKGLIISQSK